jgi:lipase ATG15
VTELKLRSRPVQISRPRLATGHAGHRGSSPFGNDGENSRWETVSVPGPDLTDKDTVVNLAKMCSDAYINAPTQPDWLNTTLGFNHSHSFGWKGDGLRGHVFSDKTNDTVIVAFKGTTFDPSNHFKSKDRLNDNLLFSCCCATQRPDPFWYGKVCDCRTDSYQCNSTCLTQELLQEGRYYPTALAIMKNVSSWYPKAAIWTVGHSLGGSMASLVGLTLNVPSVSIESPPQRLPAQRLGLEIGPHNADYHIGNTADPVFMGACNGYFSTCSIAGFAFESQCHTGKRCVYDTVQDKGWRVSIANHRIHTVITEVLESYNSTPTCEPDDECVDCFNWNFQNRSS